MYNFRKLSNNPYDFLKFNFHISLPQARLFFVEKRKPKIFGRKNVMKGGIRKCLTTLVIRQIASKIFGKIILKPSCIVTKTLIITSPRMTKQIQILKRHLECISTDLKVLWIA